MLGNKNLLRILSLVIAALLWLYVMGEVDPETKIKLSDIELTYVNTEMLTDRGLAVVQDGPMGSISAVIKGKRSDVNDVKKSTITASLDVSGCEVGKNKVAITLSMPSGITVESMSDKTASVKTEEIKWAEKPVRIRLYDKSSKTDGSGRVPWPVWVEHETLTVSGAKSSVDKVEALAANVSSKAATERGTKIMVTLTPVDKNGNRVYGVEADRERITVKLQLLESMQIKPELSEVNLPDGLKLDSMTAESVKIGGMRQALEAVQQLYGTVDLSGITKAGKIHAEVDIDAAGLPDGVYLLNTKKPIAEVTLKTAE